MSQTPGSRSQHAASGAARDAGATFVQSASVNPTALVSTGRSRARAAGAACFTCFTVAALASALLACSSEEKPPRSASYSDGTTTAPATPFRPLPGDGTDNPAPPAAPPRDRAQPDSDRVQGLPESIFGGTPRPPRDAGASEPEPDAGADADAGTN